MVPSEKDTRPQLLADITGLLRRLEYRKLEQCHDAAMTALLIRNLHIRTTTRSY